MTCIRYMKFCSVNSGQLTCWWCIRAFNGCVVNLSDKGWTMGRAALACRNYPCGPGVQVLICTDVPNYSPSEEGGGAVALGVGSKEGYWLRVFGCLRDNRGWRGGWVRRTDDSAGSRGGGGYVSRRDKDKEDVRWQAFLQNDNFSPAPSTACSLFLPFSPLPPLNFLLLYFTASFKLSPSPISTHSSLLASLSAFSPPAAVQSSPPRPLSSCQVTGTEAVTSPPPRPTVSLPPLPWQRQQRPAEPRLPTRRPQERQQERGKILENA